MTMVSVGRIAYPEEATLPNSTNAGFLASTFTFDGTNDRVAVMFRARTAITLTDVSFLTGTVTSGSVVTVEVQSVSNGRPSGTIWATNTSVNITVSGASTWQSGTLTASASIAAGDEVAIVIKHSSGSPNFQIAYYASNFQPKSYPFILQDTGTGSYGTVTPGWLLMILEDSGTPYCQPGTLPYSSVGLTAFDNADSPDEYAMRFVPPMKCRVAGVIVSLSNLSAGADFKVFLWADDGASDTESTALASISVDGDTAQATNTDGQWELYFATPVTLTKGGTYHVGVRAQTATANGVSVMVWNLTGTSSPSGAISASPAGADCYLRTRAWSAIDPGTVSAGWADDQTKVPMFRLIIDQLDDGDGSGGGGGGGPLIGGRLAA